MRIRMLSVGVAGVFLVVALLLSLVTQPFMKPIPVSTLKADADRLMKHVKYMSVTLYPRSFDRRRNLALTAQYIQDEFKAAGAIVDVQNVVVQEATYKNIIARFGPNTGPLLVIGAHYDSHGDASLGARDPRGYTPDSHRRAQTITQVVLRGSWSLRACSRRSHKRALLS
jgi:hypothetical protein